MNGLKKNYADLLYKALETERLVEEGLAKAQTMSDKATLAAGLIKIRNLIKELDDAAAS